MNVEAISHNQPEHRPKDVFGGDHTVHTGGSTSPIPWFP